MKTTQFNDMTDKIQDKMGPVQDLGKFSIGANGSVQNI